MTTSLPRRDGPLTFAGRCEALLREWDAQEPLRVRREQAERELRTAVDSIDDLMAQAYATDAIEKYLSVRGKRGDLVRWREICAQRPTCDARAAEAADSMAAIEAARDRARDRVEALTWSKHERLAREGRKPGPPDYLVESGPG